MTMAWHVRSLFHFILPCTNVERSMAFYANFGFTVTKDNRDIQWPDRVGAMFRMLPGAQGRAVQLVLPNAGELQTRIDLIEWIKPRWRNRDTEGSLEEQFPRVIALLTHNIREAFDDLVKRGLTPTMPLHPPEPSLGSLGVCAFVDPDGHIVELTEFVPGQLGSRTDDLPKRA
jgi:predicted lactoylglutathione lyase